MIQHSDICHANVSAWTLAEWLNEKPVATNVQRTNLSEGVAMWESDNQLDSRLIYHGETWTNYV